jgi:(3R)-3-hydroxyacyl-CoA dehydrogenase / 3a,7a,12a-trihydroxy-5b-cholest-24-enoyl-CoA hydratase / enoyl-CoA hydratase 2
MISFIDRVVIITGAGGGLGKEYALLLAKRGAKVVVNDFAVELANAVVSEIVASGGSAVSAVCSVTDAQKIFDTALKAFGKVDILINNAGILRDSSFIKMTDAQWQQVYEVHLLAVYKLCKLVWPVMMKQNYGRILNIASATGLYGNFGQSNYSSIKSGLVGFTKTLSIEGHAKNIKCNVLCPLATSALTKGHLPSELHETLSPALVAPVAAYMVSDRFNGSGLVIESGAGWSAEVKNCRSKGIRLESTLTAEDVEATWSSVCNFDKDSSFPSSTTDTMMAATNAVALLPPISSKAALSSKSATAKKETTSPVAAAAPKIDASTDLGKCRKSFEIMSRFMSVAPVQKLEAECKKVGGIFLFQLYEQMPVAATATPLLECLIDLKNAPGKVIVAPTAEDKEKLKPECTFNQAPKTFLEISSGKINAQLAFLKGLTKVKGAMGKASKFDATFFPRAKTEQDLMSKTVDEIVNEGIKAKI